MRFLIPHQQLARQAGRPAIFQRPKRVRPICFRIVLVISCCLLASKSSFAWGPQAHRLATNWAVKTLPPQMRGFFEANRRYLMDHSNDANDLTKKDRFERQHHFIYLDDYGRFPYLKLPHSFQQAVNRYGSHRINRNGLLPWHIGEYSLKLTEALKANNWAEAKMDAAVLGHYVADAHDPLNTTKNYDGQLTDQVGLYARFGTDLVNRFTNFFIFNPEPAVKIDDPTEYAFQTCLEANTWVDQIIFQDRNALKGLRSYTDEYFDRFYTQVGPIAMRELNGAAHDIGSYWYTAWLNAGQPALPKR